MVGEVASSIRAMVQGFSHPEARSKAGQVASLVRPTFDLSMPSSSDPFASESRYSVVTVGGLFSNMADSSEIDERRGLSIRRLLLGLGCTEFESAAAMMGRDISRIGRLLAGTQILEVLVRWLRVIDVGIVTMTIRRLSSAGKLGVK